VVDEKTKSISSAIADESPALADDRDLKALVASARSVASLLE